MDNIDELKKKTISGFFWQLSQKVSAQLISLVVSVVLARILSPNEFGLVAMTGIFLSIASVFASSGLGASLVQKKNIDELDCNTVFYAGLVLSIVVYSILFFSAPLIASLYHQQELKWIVRAQGVGLLFSSISSVQGALVSRKLDFKQFFKRTLISTVASCVVGLYMALSGYSYWALIGQSFTSTIVGVIAMNRIVKWLPSWQFSFERLKILYGFGLNLTAANLIGTFFNELRNFLIGFRYTPSDLAYANRGSSIPTIFDSNIRGSISGILFPAMSRLNGDKEMVKVSIRRSMMTTTFLIAPTMVLLSATSAQIIPIVYSSKWAMAIPFMQVVCFQFLFNIIGEANLQAINAIGRSDVTFKLEFVKKPIYLAILLFTMNISPLAMVAGNTIYGLIGGAINAFPNKKLINYQYTEQIKDIAPQICLSIVMGTLVFGIGLWKINVFLVLLTQCIIGMTFYFVLAYLLHLESMDYLIKTVKELRNKK